LKAWIIFLSYNVRDENVKYFGQSTPQVYGWIIILSLNNIIEVLEHQGKSYNLF